MHDGMPYGRNQGQGQGHSREVDRQSPTGLILVSLFYACNITTVEINSGVHLLKKLNPGIEVPCLLPVVLVLRIWSCLHHCWKYALLPCVIVPNLIPKNDLDQKISQKKK